MVKNMIEYDYNSSNEDYEYDSNSENEYYDYRNDPLYKIMFPIITNEELYYMHENYPGKYIGIGESFRKFPKIVELKKDKLIKRDISKLEPITNIFKNFKKQEKEPQQKVIEKQEKEKKTWNTNNTVKTFQEKIENIDFPSLEIMNKINTKQLKVETNDNEWKEIKKKDRKNLSPISLNSYKTNTTTSSNSSFTKLCVYYLNKKKCPHNNCRYAHNENELIIKNCCFDKECKFVKFVNNKFYNLNSDKICKYIHSSESKDDYLSRIKNINQNIKNTKTLTTNTIKEDKNTNFDINKYNYTKTNTLAKQEIKEEEKKEIIKNDDDNEWTTVKNKTKFEKNRDKAFNILSDKDKLKDKLKRTKLCLSVINKTICPHKNNCRYAHNIQELTVKECLFQDECNYIKKEKNNYIYKNISKTKICECKHKDEKLDNYYERLGLNSGIKKVILK